VSIAKAAVSSQEYHRFERYAGRSEHAANFLSVKHAWPVRGFMKTDCFLTRPFEARAVTNGLVEEAGIVAVLEDCPNSLNFVAKCRWSRSLRQTGPETLEIVAGQVRHQPVQTEGRFNPRASGMVIDPRPLCQLAAVHKPTLGG